MDNSNLEIQQSRQMAITKSMFNMINHNLHTEDHHKRQEQVIMINTLSIITIKTNKEAIINMHHNKTKETISNLIHKMKEIK